MLSRKNAIALATVLGTALVVSVLSLISANAITLNPFYNAVPGDVSKEVPTTIPSTLTPDQAIVAEKNNTEPIPEGDAGDTIPGTTEEHTPVGQATDDVDNSSNATTAARINSVTVKTDKPAYNIGDSVQISGHVNPNEQVLIFIYNPNGDPLTSEVIESNESGNYEFSFGFVQNGAAEAPVIPGTWTVKATFGNETAEVSITVKDPNCPEIDKEFCPITDPKYKNPKPTNPVPDDVTVIGNPVYADNGTAIGFIPSGITLKGNALDSCKPLVARAFDLLSSVQMNETLHLAKGTVVQNMTYADYVDKYVGTINCRDTEGRGNALAYVEGIHPNTIYINPSLLNSINVAMPEKPTCIPGPLYDYSDPRNDLSNQEWNKRSICNHDWQVYESVMARYNDRFKPLAGILVHEATHSKQLNNPLAYLSQFLGDAFMHMRKDGPILEQANALKEMNYTIGSLTVDQSYESFLLHWYQYYYHKPMPANVYKDFFGRDPPVSTQVLTDSIPVDVKHDLARLEAGHISTQ